MHYPCLSLAYHSSSEPSKHSILPYIDGCKESAEYLAGKCFEYAKVADNIKVTRSEIVPVSHFFIFEDISALSGCKKSFSDQLLISQISKVRDIEGSFQSLVDHTGKCRLK